LVQVLSCAYYLTERKKGGLMKTTQQTIVAVFENHGQAEETVHDLQRSGINPDRIRFAGSENMTGGKLSSLKSLFTGHKGGAYDDLINLDVPSDDARFYEQEYESGHPILAVMSNGNMTEIKDVMARHGGYGTGKRFAQQTTTQGQETRTSEQTMRSGMTTGQSARSGITSTTQGTRGATTGRNLQGEAQEKLLLHEEQLRVQKQAVETGEARLRKEVITEQKKIDVPLSREEVYIERRAGSGKIDNEPISAGETQWIPVREEQVTVEKQPIVREEVILGKRQVQENKQVADSIRREDARVEQTGNVHIQNRNLTNEQAQRNP
jgi:uncharacterized protein (TIGR02271 family)